MKLVCIVFLVMFVSVAAATVPSNAEIIHYKDGRTSEKEILYRSKGVLWVKYAGGSVGISVRSVARIDADDGTVSKYDFRRLNKNMRRSLAGKKYEEAFSVASLLLESFPRNARLRYLRGVLAQRLKKTDIARNDYIFLIDNKAAGFKVYNNLGAIYALDGRRDDAEKAFRKALAIEPRSASVCNNLADLYMKEGSYKKALDVYLEVLALEPKNTGALYNLGVAYERLGDPGRARGAWEKILGVSPEDPDAKAALEALKKREEIKSGDEAKGSLSETPEAVTVP